MITPNQHMARFWNSSLRSECPTLDDSDGITLRSLGGVFIGTVVGLAIALVALGLEVLYYRSEVNCVFMSLCRKKEHTEVGAGVIQVASTQKY